jgi:hypothetical protein
MDNNIRGRVAPGPFNETVFKTTFSTGSLGFRDHEASRENRSRDLIKAAARISSC